MVSAGEPEGLGVNLGVTVVTAGATVGVADGVIVAAGAGEGAEAIG